MHFESQADRAMDDPKVHSWNTVIEIDTFAKCNAPTVHSCTKKVNGEFIDVFRLRLHYFPSSYANHRDVKTLYSDIYYTREEAEADKFAFRVESELRGRPGTTRVWVGSKCHSHYSDFATNS